MLVEFVLLVWLFLFKGGSCVCMLTLYVLYVTLASLLEYRIYGTQPNPQSMRQNLEMTLVCHGTNRFVFTLYFYFTFDS